MLDWPFSYVSSLWFCAVVEFAWFSVLIIPEVLPGGSWEVAFIRRFARMPKSAVFAGWV
jgi:hypothetical protein